MDESEENVRLDYSKVLTKKERDGGNAEEDVRLTRSYRIRNQCLKESVMAGPLGKRFRKAEGDGSLLFSEGIKTVLLQRFKRQNEIDLGK